MRRSLFVIVGAYLTSIGLLASCAPSDASCPEPCGTLVIVSAPVRSMLPPQYYWDVDLGFYDLVFSRLADLDPARGTVGPDGFTPRLAREWRYEDSLTLALSIDPAAKWHDGRPVTAHDVAFTFDFYRDPVVNSDARSALGRIQSVTARDSGTVVFTFDGVYPGQFFDAVYHMWILPKHLLESADRSQMEREPFTSRPIGSGPYRLVRQEEQFIVLEADPAFHLEPPGLPSIVWRFVGGLEPAITAMITGEADFIHNAPGAAGDRIRDNAEMVPVEYATNTYNYIALNLRDAEHGDQQHWLFESRAVRRALNMAVDRSAIVTNVLGGYGVVARGPIVPSLWTWSDDLEEPLSYDPTAARALLRDEGWNDTDGDGVLERNGRPLRFDVTVRADNAQHTQTAEIIQQMLHDVGADMVIRDVEQTTYQQIQNDRTFDAILVSIGHDPTPAGLRDWTSDAIDEYNFGSYVNPDVERLYDDAKEATTVEEARAKWLEIVRIVGEDAPALWLYNPSKIAFIHDRFDSVVVRPDQPWANVWKWRVNPRQALERDRIGVN